MGFIWIKYKHTTAFAFNQRNHVIDALERCDYPIKNIENAQMVWTDQLDRDVANGLWSVRYPNVIFLCNHWNSNDPMVLDRIVPTIGHEGVHRQQYLDNKIRYVAIVLTPGVRYISIEIPAEAWEKRLNETLPVPESWRL